MVTANPHYPHFPHFSLLSQQKKCSVAIKKCCAIIHFALDKKRVCLYENYYDFHRKL